MGQARSLKYFAYGQLGFFVLVLLCFALLPQTLAVNEGLSYFGVHWQTIGPFGLACALVGFFTLRTADLLPSEPNEFVRAAGALRVIVLLLPGVLLTPYTINGWFDLAHRLFGASLFLLQLWLVVWLLARSRHRVSNFALLALQIAGGLLALLSLGHWLNYEIMGQLLFQLMFGILLSRLLTEIMRRPRREF